MMPQSSQNLYFHLGMNADDDGFCEHFSIMRMTESKPDDLKVLQAKDLVRIFDDKVLIIKEWKENNYIQRDRYTPSKYLEIYKKELALLSHPVELDTKCIQNVSKVDTQVRLGKDRKEEIAAAKPPQVFSLKEEIKKMEDHARRDLNIIALYFDERKPDIRTREQLSVAIRRHLRAAGQLKVFSDDQILAAVPKAKRQTDDWTIETLVKVLTK
jgi:hypothetical protein